MSTSEPAFMRTQRTFSLRSLGDEASGYRVILQYADDYSKFTTEVSLDQFITSFAFILRLLPDNVRDSALRKLNAEAQPPAYWRI